MSRSIAFFDFDGTLVKGDSLLPFLGFVVGWPKVTLAFARALLHPAQEYPDWRGNVKAALLRRTLTGVSAVKAREAANHLAPLRSWKEPAIGALYRLKQEGATIVVATGALALYMPRLLEGLPVDHIIATEMQQENGLLTGEMAGGNCVRAEKARRVQEYLQTHGPFTHIHGYGNAPHDLPMLALCTQQTIV